MADMDKVLKGLEMCKIDFCDECPYDDEANCTFKLKHDALELLKEQEQDRIEIAHEMVSNSILMYKGKEIVRCKDCIHWKSEDGKFGKCKICHSVSSSNGWFCADGEREET